MHTMNPPQCRAARALLNVTQPELAKAAGVGLSTVVAFETERRLISKDAEATLQAALEALGVEFIWPKGDAGAGVRLARQEV